MSDISAPVRLSNLSVGQSATIVTMPTDDQLTARLGEMGLFEGVLVQLAAIAPLGDPLEIRVRGYCLGLKKREADQIGVVLTPPDGSNA